MSTVEAPQPQPQPQPPAAMDPPAPGAAPPAPAQARTRRTLPPWAGRAASPAIVLLTAALVAVASVEGQSLGGATLAEILTVLGGGALVVAALLSPAVARVPGGWPLAAFLVLAVLSALSMLWSIDPAATWLEANRTIAYLAAFAGAASLAAVARDRAAAFAGGLLLGVTVVCGIAVLSKIVPEWLNETERFARLREPFGYWNAVGLAGALAVPASLWLGSRREGPPALNILAYPALTLAITATLLAYSRGALVAGVVGAAAWFILVPSRRLRGAAVLLLSAGAAAFVAAWTFGQNALTADHIELAERGAAGRELLVCLVAVLLLVYIAGMVVSFLSDLRPLELRHRRGLSLALLVGVALIPVAIGGVLSTTDQGLGGSISTAWKTITDPKAEPPSNEPGRLAETGSVRARYWDDAWRMAKDRPAAGWGAGGFATIRPRYRTDDIDVQHAHGYVAQTLSDLGLLGLGLSLLLLGAWAWAARLAIRAAGAGPHRTVLVTLMATGLVFGVHSLVDWTWFTAGTALTGILAAGFVAGAAPAGRWALALGGRTRIVAAAIVAILALSAAWSAWQPLRAEHAVDDALAASSAGRHDTARDHADRAHDLNPLSAEPLQTRAAVERRAGDNAAAENALEARSISSPGTTRRGCGWPSSSSGSDDPRRALDSIRAAVYLNPGSFTVIQRYLDIARTLQSRGG